MKGKGIWRKCLCIALVAGMLVTLPGTAFSDWDDGTKVEWTYDNSILVHVETDESRIFLPEDFPGIDCKKVFVLEKKQKEKGFEYKLVLLLRNSGDKVLERAMEKVRKQPMVVGAERNGEYVQPSILRLNHSFLYLAVGETVNLFIKDLDLNKSNEHWIRGIRYTLNLSEYNPDSFDKDSFLAYGISRFWPETEVGSYILRSQPEELEAQKSRNGVYYGISKEGTEDVFDAAARLASAPEILNVSIESFELGFLIITEGEYWNIKNTDIASCSLSGGTMSGIDGDAHILTPLNQNAAVQGLKPGVTTLTCDRRGRKGIGSANCTVIVYEPGSKNNPGDMDHDGVISTDDALQVLKHSAGLISLNEAGRQTADLDQNGIADTDDALLMLKIAVGIL